MFLIYATAFFLCIVLTTVLFWPRVKPLAHTGTSLLRKISVLIPARNEAANIANCLQAVLEQGPSILEILVYDDHSDDGTAALVNAVQARAPHVRLIEPLPLPPGWCGKNFACLQLAAAAQGDWLLFLDADARVLPGAAAGMLSAALDRHLTLLSCWPGFLLVGFSERALMPLLNFTVFSIFPSVLSLFRREPSLGLAHGACMLFHRATYWTLGGHEAVRDEIFEDTRLAQLWRIRGERSLCLDGQSVVRVRMYARFIEIWRGFEKNFYPAFKHEWMFWFFLTFHFTFFLLPFLSGNWIAATLVLLIRLLLALRFAQPWWSALLHPIGQLLMILLGISSWWQCHTGRGVAWKGRVYRARRV